MVVERQDKILRSAQSFPLEVVLVETAKKTAEAEVPAAVAATTTTAVEAERPTKVAPEAPARTMPPITPAVEVAVPVRLEKMLNLM
jgi:hypothetical protein